MIIYQATKAQFSADVLDDVIEVKILNEFQEKLHRRVAKTEIASHRNSLQYMERVINDPRIPDDCGIAIEYHLPRSSKRVDFIITGTNEEDVESVVLVELKQWSEATRSDKDGVVNTYVGRSERELLHPSYQAWSYASLLQNFNETIEKESINLVPCAYLHNYLADDVMTHEHYRDYIEKAPVFLRGEATRLREFVKRHIKYGDKKNVLYRIEKGRFRPSKFLADSIDSMIKGNEEFVLIDDQKLVLEEAIALNAKASDSKKKVLIVNGGPGTGKSVVAVNILAKLTKQSFTAKYVSKNAAPRSVYEVKLTGSHKKSYISNLFGGSGEYHNSERRNEFDALIVDEAHRLNLFSGLYKNLGENQVKEIMNAARLSVFFVDEDQRVTLEDIGTNAEVRRIAATLDAEVVEMKLESQFRCGGSDGYLSWLDNTLGIRTTANQDLAGIDFDFRVIDSPVELWNLVYQRNLVNNKSRVVAGYCWDWKSKNDPEAYDVIIPEFDFKMRWNLASDGSKWIMAENSINEIGCIHTCQGLEVDYVGVIIGKDLSFSEGQVKTNVAARSRFDSTVKGYKRLLETQPVETKKRLDAIVKNTYKTLMTRGMKGCYVYCEDKDLAAYLKQCASR